jgi:hypothetical protein
VPGQAIMFLNNFNPKNKQNYTLDNAPSTWLLAAQVTFAFAVAVAFHAVRGMYLHAERLLAKAGRQSATGGVSPTRWESIEVFGPIYEFDTGDDVAAWVGAIEIAGGRPHSSAG